jgi:hypothetical protein
VTPENRIATTAGYIGRPVSIFCTPKVYFDSLPIDIARGVVL